MSFDIIRYGQPDANTLLFQMVDDHDLEVIEQEVSHIRELFGGQDFCLTAVKINDWNQDLSPWPAPADRTCIEGAVLNVARKKKKNRQSISISTHILTWIVILPLLPVIHPAAHHTE